MKLGDGFSWGKYAPQRVQSPESLIATLSQAASETTLAKSANGSGGAGDSPACQVVCSVEQ